jgi:hypothetical protein
MNKSLLRVGPSVVDGKFLVHAKMNKREAVARGAQIALGEIILHPSITQAAHIVGASVPYVAAATLLSPEVREAIANGSDTTTPIMPAAKPPKTKPTILRVAS